MQVVFPRRLAVLFVAGSVQEPAEVLDVAEARRTVLHRQQVLPGLGTAHQEVDQAASGATVRVQWRSVVLFGGRTPYSESFGSHARGLV